MKFPTVKGGLRSSTASYQTPRGVRRESRTLTARFRGGKLNPVMATAVRGNEGGTLSQSITLELDPIAGRMITPITGELYAIYVPVQAIDALLNPGSDYAGLTEVVREKLLSGAPLFGLEDENTISKRCGINPVSIGGVKKVSVMARLAHNAAVNFLRLRKYHKANLLTSAHGSVSPAIVGQTVLDRFNGVLDPDDRINGSVELDLAGLAPVRGIGLFGTPERGGSNYMLETDGGRTYTTPVWGGEADGGSIAVDVNNATNRPQIYAELDEISAGNVSLVDFYNAETKDKLVRVMQQMVEDNPQYGQEMVLRWAHGMSVDTGKTPFLIHHESRVFGRNIVPATDSSGVQNDVMRSDMMLQMGFTVPVPRTELGGVIITFAVLKPDETISSQPHPFLSDVWGVDNFVADELALDPVPVTIRQLDSDCLSEQEGTVAFYTGLNALKGAYIHYGLGRQLDPQTVENKTAIWQLDIPLSVTPDSILYPSDLSHYPFADQLAEVCTYTISSNLTLQTPMIMGPTPVETLALIDSEDLFEDSEE